MLANRRYAPRPSATKSESEARSWKDLAVRRKRIKGIRRSGAGRNKRLIPAPEVAALLTGTCACGCGKTTKIAKASCPDRMQYYGYPLRYRHGHQGRNAPPDRTSQWKGGRSVNQKGYVLIYAKGNPMTRAIGPYVPEHRLVMAAHLGRPLERSEHVHHKNGNRADNRIENLELVLINAHPIGQRAEDLVSWARQILEQYGHLYP